MPIMKERRLFMRRSCTLLLFAFSLLGAASTPAQPLTRSTIALPVSLAVPAAGTVPASAAPAAAEQADISIPNEVIRAAMKCIGVPYVRGGDSREGFDCSGLISSVFRQTASMELPRRVQSLFRSGTEVTRPLHIGDLLFFDTEAQETMKDPTHVGVYIGADQFVHAASEGPKTGVIISSLQLPYYHERFLGARRVIPWRAPVLAMKLTDDYQSLSTASPFPSREAMKICVYNDMTGGGPVDLTLLKDGTEILSRRIVPGAQAPAQIDLTPEIGQWTVRVSRIWKGRELQSLTFQVEE
jgi:cell wall-associated NlpC family hydrolase